MLLQTNSYIVPKEKRAEHSRLLRRFRAALCKLGCDNFEVFEQVSSNWSGNDSNGRYVQIMRFRDRAHQVEVQEAERNDPSAQGLIREFCELINFPYQQQQGLFAVGYYTNALAIVPGRTDLPTEDSIAAPAPAAEGSTAAPIGIVQDLAEQRVERSPDEAAHPAAPLEPLAAEQKDIFAAPIHPNQSEPARLDEIAAPVEEPEDYLESDPSPSAAATEPPMPADWKEPPTDDEGIITELPAAAETAAIEPSSFDTPAIVESARSSPKHAEELETEELETFGSQAIGDALDRALDGDATQFDPAPGQTERGEKNGLLDDDAALQALSDRQFDEPPPGHEFHKQDSGDFNGQNGKVGHKT